MIGKFGKRAAKLLCIFLIPVILIAALASDDMNETANNISSMGEFTDEQYEFVMMVCEYSYEFKSEYQVLTSVTIAQAIEESGWGTSSIAKNANNLFGMKGTGTNGSYISSSGKWQKFNSKKESVEAYSRLISNRYGCKGVTNVEDVLLALTVGGYCEGSGYANKIKNHIQTYNLIVFDNLSADDIEAVKNRTYGSTDNTGETANKGDKSERARWLFPNGTPSSQFEMKQYLTTVSVEILDINGNPKSAFITCHRKLAPSIQAAYKEMKEKGFRAYDNGCYNWRGLTGSSKSLSNHSFGTAVDINPAYNPYVKATSSSVWKNAPKQYKIDGEIVAIWKKYGFYWGGDYKNIKDYMHFEYISGT